MGAARVSVEIADELKKHGYSVDKFDIHDAFPRTNKVFAYFHRALFPGRALQYIRANAHKYDVIQGEDGDLPFTKQELNFNGILVARSNGLQHMFDRYQKGVKTKRVGSVTGNTLRWLARQIDGGLKWAATSFDNADAIVVINGEELDFIASLGHGAKGHLVPVGLSEQRFADFAAHRVEPKIRLAKQQIVFIGHWGERKGSNDFPAIVRRVRDSVPAASFLFLGTHADPNSLKRAFDERDRNSITSVPSYQADDLPDLLRDATIGILPSYIEGFPSAILEQLAAGIPSIAYNAPGGREMLRHFDEEMVVPTGDAAAAGDKLISLLRRPLPEYAALSRRSLEIADKYHWNVITEQMMEIYAITMGRLQPG